MDADRYAKIGIAGGSLAGTVKAAFAVAVYLLARERVIDELRRELAAEGIAGAAPDAAVLYWVILVLVPPLLIGLSMVYGTVLALVLGWRGAGSPPVVVAASLLVGVLDGSTTSLSGAGRGAILASHVLAWLAFAALFVRAERGDGDLAGLVPEVTVDPRLVAVLTAAGLLGGAALTPALLAAGTAPAAAAVNVLVVGALVAAACLVGAGLGPRVGLGAPAVVAWLDGDPPDRRPLALAAAAGVGVGAGLLALDAAFQPLVRGAIRAPGLRASGPWWAGLLASLYGGLTEELLLRFGLVTALVWLGWRAGWRDGDAPAAGTVWAAIVVAALAFGAAHLPATASAFELTPAVVARALVLNGAAGVVFGWLYWRRGLLAAMVAHAGADVVLGTAVAVAGAL